MAITGGRGNYDPGGIAFAPDGTMWVASEGNASDTRQNRLLQLDDDGNVVDEVALPDVVVGCRAASTSRGSLGSGFEGVTVVPQEGGGYRVFAAQQRGWDYTTEACEPLDDETGFTRVWVYDADTGEWLDPIAYELEPKPANAGWVGLSEIVVLEDGDFGFIERDNRTGDWAEFKALVKIDLSDGVADRDGKQVADLIGPMRRTNGWISDKPEGFTVTSDGLVYVVTDNDGVDGSTGETQLLRLGPLSSLFD